MKRLHTRLAIVTLMAVVALTSYTFATEEKLFYEDRKDIPEQYRWDLTIIFPDVDAWETA